MASELMANCGVVIEIGGMPILLRTDDPVFRRMLEERYRGFTSSKSVPEFELDVNLHESANEGDADSDVQVRKQNGRWVLRRGDFIAEWQSTAGRGEVRQSRNPYAIDSVLRIVHSLVLASRGGFLVHAASVVRRGRAFLFAGISGAGKTTISRLAPRDTCLLTDEISYVRRDGSGYVACGTPFAGELARIGENTSAPTAGLYFLEKGPDNRIEPISQADAVRSLLRNILFFAEDQELVRRLFQSAWEFVEAVPVRRLIFAPDQRVWQLIG